MGETAVLGEADGTATEPAEHIEVWRLGGKGERQRGIRRLAIETGTSQVSAEEEMG